MPRIYWFYLIGLVGACTTSCANQWGMQAGANVRFQHDLDIARLQDLKTFGALVEEYKIKTGEYPLRFTGKPPALVIIPNKKKYLDAPKIPEGYTLVPVTEFIRTLETALGRKIDLPFDPQREMVIKPNYYVYTNVAGNYVLSVYLFNSFAFSREVEPYYHVVAIGNSGRAADGYWPYQELMVNPDYNAAISDAPYYPGQVDKIRAVIRESGIF